jgi:2-hydroxychromene-2-carboxylate isomerase
MRGARIQHGILQPCRVSAVSTQIDFHFDFISPYSYLANAVLPRLAARHSASIRYRPLQLRELMQLVGNRPTTIECRNKGLYAITDVGRWASRYQVKFSPSPYWQGIDFGELGRGALAAIDQGRGAAYIDAVWAALYGESLDLGQRAVLLRVLDQAGFDGAALLRQAGGSDYAARLRDNTAVAAEKGVFGSPTIFLGKEMFFGNDRLDFLETALRAA